MRVTDLARVIARVAHRGQTRMDGVEPYLNHPERVAKKLASRPGGVPTYVYVAALLHDVLEDSSFEAVDLLDLGIPEEAVEIVEAVSRREGETYAQFIERVATHPNPWAQAVKVADIRAAAEAVRAAEEEVSAACRALERLGSSSATGGR